MSGSGSRQVEYIKDVRISRGIGKEYLVKWSNNLVYEWAPERVLQAWNHKIEEFNQSANNIQDDGGNLLIKEEGTSFHNISMKSREDQEMARQEFFTKSRSYKPVGVSDSALAPTELVKAGTRKRPILETRPEKESDLVINKKYKLPSANDTTSSNEHILHSTTLSFSTSHLGTNYEVNNDKTNSSNSHRASDMTSSAILIPERIDAKLFNTRSPQLSTGEHSRYTWQGVLSKRVNEQFVANVMVTSLDGDNRADSKLFEILQTKRQLTVTSLIPLKYLLALYKSHEDDNKITESPSMMWSTDDASTSLEDMATELEYRGQASIIWFRPWIVVFLCPSSSEVRKSFRIAEPSAPFIIMSLSLRSLPERLEYSIMIDSAELLTRRDLKDADQYNGTLMSLGLQFPKEFNSQFANATFTIVAPSAVQYETDDMIAYLKTLGGTYEHWNNCHDVSIVLIHRIFVRQMMTIPHLDKLKRNKVRIYLFGYGEDPWASPIPKEVYRAGGIITVSSQILCMEDGVIDTVLGHINHQKKTSPTALWLFKIHSDTFRHLREIIDNVSDVHSRNRIQDALTKLQNAINSKRVEVFAPNEVWEPIIHCNPSEILHWSMMRMHLFYHYEFRHFIILDVQKNGVFEKLGLEIMSLDQFKQVYGHV
ncbi:526_t:CDS:10 [Paraglomus brasilianum]|uniref:526_t:CDS:1 n=1 Tax=Paraglomus brasilianum TaxID=144538 RepID=A0A9N9A0E3_9GLOM|nr:526_t:CDS:10 [Paraglomus brasilianum]